MNLSTFLDNYFVLFKESKTLQAPICMIYYHYYDDIKEISAYLETNKQAIQCVVGHQHQAFGS